MQTGTRILTALIGCSLIVPAVAHAGDKCKPAAKGVEANAYMVVTYSHKSRNKVWKKIPKYKKAGLPTDKKHPELFTTTSVKGFSGKKRTVLVAGVPAQEEVAVEMVRHIKKLGWKKAMCQAVSVKDPEAMGVIVVTSSKPKDRGNGDDYPKTWKEIDPFFIPLGGRASSTTVLPAKDNSVVIPFVWPKQPFHKKLWLSTNFGATIDQPSWDCSVGTIKPPATGQWVHRVVLEVTPKKCSMVGD